ncbi:MAG: Uma2 family endonuclease [Acidobacteriota bacterium]
MSRLTNPPISDTITYPESDGKPMADNTKQYEWIVTIKENLDGLLDNAFVAADLFWYPVPSNPKIVQAPDIMVAIGRPKGHRGSYRQWEEGDIAPQIVFEILSSSNTPIEMLRKHRFYEHYGVEEYYVYDPEKEELFGYIRAGGKLQTIDELAGWLSPLIGIRFEMKSTGLEIYLPNGNRFVTFQQLRQRADKAEREVQRLLEKLKELGVDPESQG